MKNKKSTPLNSSTLNSKMLNDVKGGGSYSENNGIEQKGLPAHLQPRNSIFGGDDETVGTLPHH